MYGRSFLQSRQVSYGARLWRRYLTHCYQIVAYGSTEAADSIKYSGTEVPLEKAHPRILQEIQAELEDRLKTRFNHCMLNRYDDGSVHIGSHSDNMGRSKSCVFSKTKT